MLVEILGIVAASVLYAAESIVCSELIFLMKTRYGALAGILMTAIASVVIMLSILTLWVILQ